MPLTDIKIRQAKPKDKSYKLSDSHGLYLEIAPAGGKWWRYKYRIDNKEKRISLGVYPQVSLKEARDLLDEARKLVSNGVDPSTHRKATKAARAESISNSFEVVAREWFGKNSGNWVQSHSEKIIRRLERDAFPYIGALPIAGISPPQLLTILKRIEERGTIETAHRLLQNLSQIFRYAVATARAQHDPASPLRGALSPTKEHHHASITEPKEIGALLRAIDGYDGQLITQCALKFAPLVFVRPGELRHAEWSEIDFDNAEWRIPAVRMKMRIQHLVPLSFQALKILKELQPVTGQGKYIFPGARSNARPMSENTVNAALRRLGYAKDEMTGHGFRSMASTRLHEMGYKSDAIERQLAHGERNAVKAAYNYAEYMTERRTMMQEWANYLDMQKSGAEIIPIQAA